MISIKNLIRDAHLLAGTVNIEDEIQGYYETKGLDLLNDILTDWSKMGVYIPFTTRLTFQTVANQYIYTVSPPIADYMEGNIQDGDLIQSVLNWIDIKINNTLNYNTPANRPSRIFIQDNFTEVSLTTGEGSSNILLYPKPDKVYTVNLTLKQYYQKVALNTQPSEFPDYYKKVLTYQLAKDFMIFWQMGMMDQMFLAEYTRLIKELKATIPIDITVQTEDPLRSFRRFRPWGRYYGA